MPPTLTFNEIEIELMVAIFNQIGVGKLDRKQLAADLGLANLNTLDGRLFRFRKKLATGKTGGEPSAEVDNPAAPAKAKGSAKKRKAENVEVKGEIDELNSHFEDAILHTPTRKKAGRKAKPKSFTEDEADEDLEQDWA